LLQELTGIEARVTVLGHLQRGGIPSVADRLLATRLGAACTESISKGESGVMLAAKGNKIIPVQLEEVAGNVKLIPPDHNWITTARSVGTCLGD
jgi:6-phosphofructokinase 1